MITIKEKKNCCGCAACVQICPKQCISMQADSEGFLYPAVDADICVQCGVCERVCPVLHNPTLSAKKPEIYAAYALDTDIREVSSSGGIFSLLAEWVLNHQGLVFGAAFDEDFSVHHIKVESAADMYKLRGSKYLQSRIENTYAEAKTALEEGKMVLFSGVGCQIAGLRTYLKKDFDNLYTADVLCHGVPSPRLWEKYVREQESCICSNITSASFRSKVQGWKVFSMEHYFDNGQRYCKSLTEDSFMQCFLRNICLRPACHNCQFKKFPRVSDLTIGDAWGIADYMPDMDDDRGTSLVIINSSRGNQLWNAVKNQTKFRKGKMEQLLPPSADSRRSVRPHYRRNRFFRDMEKGVSMEKLAKLSRKPLHRRVLSFGKRVLKSLLKKIGIL